MQRNIRIALLSCFLSATSFSQDISSDARLRAVEEEVMKRRKLLEAAQGERGIVFAPLKHQESWFSIPREVKVEDSPLVTCGQLFASLTRCEVMVSGRVAQKRISVSTEPMVSDRAAEIFRRAIESQGVVVLSIGTRILALVDKSDVAAPKG